MLSPDVLDKGGPGVYIIQGGGGGGGEMKCLYTWL